MQTLSARKRAMDPDAKSNISDGPDAGSVLSRKTRAGQDVRQTHTMSLAKALRLTLAKVSDDQLDMAMAVIGAWVVVCSAVVHCGGLRFAVL